MLDKYLFQPGEVLPAENVDSIDPDNVIPQAAGYLTGGTGHSDLSVFQALGAGANNGKIKINVDGTEYDNVGIELLNNYQGLNEVIVSSSAQSFSGAGNANSFNSNILAKIYSISVTADNWTAGTRTLTVRQGENINGTILGTATAAGGAGGTTSLTFTFGSPIILQKGQTYCWVVDGSQNIRYDYRTPASSYGWGDVSLGNRYNGTTWLSGAAQFTITGDKFLVLDSYSKIATLLQSSIRTATGKTETVAYNTNKFVITSSTANRSSQILKLMTPSTGTDISGAGATPYLDMADNATETQGTGEEYRIVRLDSNGLVNKNLAPSQKTDINRSIFSIIASETLKTSADTERSTTGTTYIKLKEIVFNAFYSGIIRVKFNLWGQSSSLAYGRIYINGVAIGVERSIDNTGALYAEDISVNKGDLVQLYIKSQVNGSPARCSNFRLYYDLVNVGAGTNVIAIN